VIDGTKSPSQLTDNVTIFVTAETRQHKHSPEVEFLDEIHTKVLKVDGNEKLGRSKRRGQLNFSPTLWGSRVILNLNMSFLCKRSISFSACYSFINRRCHDE
jgi:hypothetical protein